MNLMYWTMWWYKEFYVNIGFNTQLQVFWVAEEQTKSQTWNKDVMHGWVGSK